MRWNSLSVRLMAIFAAVTIVVIVFMTVYSTSRAKAALEETLDNHGRTLLGVMESHATDYLIQHDYGTLRGYVSEMTAKEPVVSFAAVVNAEGIVIAHSDHSREGKTFAQGAGAAASGAGKVFRREYQDGGNRILELTKPVSAAGKGLGVVQIGINHRGVDSVLTRLALSVGLGGGVVLVAALIGVRVLTGKMTAGFNRLVETSKEISGGELRIRVPEEGYDEIRTLAGAFNTMTGDLRTMLGQVQEAGSTVGEFSSRILAVIQEQATNAAQEAASVSEVTATVEELSRTSRQIAQNAESVKEAANKTVEVARQGNVLVREGVEETERIKERVGDIARKTLFLGEKSHEIGKVMDIIKEIASEIHLLALNAAIESAAAGEYGRRFSVVASEVRRLADKTRESTETIRPIISEIQAATSASIQATEQGTRDVDKWKETISLSTNAFEEIIEGIQRTSEASMQISLATHQQTSANEQVVQAMHQIAETVRMTAAKMKESSGSAGELKGKLEKLQKTASVFRV